MSTGNSPDVQVAVLLFHINILIVGLIFSFHLNIISRSSYLLDSRLTVMHCGYFFINPC